MIPYDPLQQLYDLDRASPLFHERLRDFLCGDAYRNALPNLQGDNLVSLLKYLDNVSFYIIFPRAALKTGVGSRWYLQSRNPRLSGITARTQGSMQR